MKLYEHGTANIWTDPHIRKQMVRAHLDPGTEAASRNPRTIEKTVEWILHGTVQPGKLIDLGCGPGLYAEKYAEKSWDVCGVDINGASLEYARASAANKGLTIRYREASYLEPFTDETFDLATCIYCDFGALTVHLQREFLANVHRLIVPGGLFLFDVFGPGISRAKAEGKTWTRHDEAGFWSSLPCYVLSETRHFADECVWGTKYVVIADDGEAKSYVVWDHYFTEATIGALLEEFGFAVDEIKRDLIPTGDFAADDVLFVRARLV
ncbi:MAG: class I SAM-dependent methyltransferase [Spirochaetaceae bacterium]|nr:MAG: class I SAM-dependent methyltransferase [Spirochaetaceae bacterium]